MKKPILKGLAFFTFKIAFVEIQHETLNSRLFGICKILYKN